MRWLYVSFDVPDEAAEPPSRFWPAVLGWQLGEPWQGHPEFRSLRPPLATCTPTSSASRVRLALHFDLGVDDVAAAAARLVALGATQVADFDIWRVMRSPGGLAFCLVPGGGESVPAPSVWPNGHRSRLVQLCIDSPADLHDAEVAFWRAATGWRYEPSALKSTAANCSRRRPRRCGCCSSGSVMTTAPPPPVCTSISGPTTSRPRSSGSRRSARSGATRATVGCSSPTPAACRSASRVSRRITVRPRRRSNAALLARLSSALSASS